ncbi:hypothetical protein DFJ74DRAFT_745853 [Hyaloraphidium curvatum]|nr:hypothetical protein DFJ74DRAFT_745853 [Hyaloraphidium curvatum]
MKDVLLTAGYPGTRASSRYSHVLRFLRSRPCTSAFGKRSLTASTRDAAPSSHRSDSPTNSIVDAATGSSSPAPWVRLATAEYTIPATCTGPAAWGRAISVSMVTSPGDSYRTARWCWPAISRKSTERSRPVQLPPTGGPAGACAVRAGGFVARGRPGARRSTPRSGTRRWPRSPAHAPPMRRPRTPAAGSGPPPTCTVPIPRLSTGPVAGCGTGAGGRPAKPCARSCAGCSSGPAASVKLKSSWVSNTSPMCGCCWSSEPDIFSSACDESARVDLLTSAKGDDSSIDCPSARDQHGVSITSASYS